MLTVVNQESIELQIPYIVGGRSMNSIAMVNSDDAPGRLCLSEFSWCLLQLANMMNVLDKPIPQILVLHVSDAVGDAFGVGPAGVIRHNRNDSSEPHDYYEVWLVGTPHVSTYVLALLAILEDCFMLNISSHDRQHALETVVLTAKNSLYDSTTVH